MAGRRCQANAGGIVFGAPVSFFKAAIALYMRAVARRLETRRAGRKSRAGDKGGVITHPARDLAHPCGVAQEPSARRSAGCQENRVQRAGAHGVAFVAQAALALAAMGPSPEAAREDGPGWGRRRVSRGSTGLPPPPRSSVRGPLSADAQRLLFSNVVLRVPSLLRLLWTRSRYRRHARSINESPSSRGLGHRPFTAVTGVRIPLGTPHLCK